MPLCSQFLQLCSQCSGKPRHLDIDETQTPRTLAPTPGRKLGLISALPSRALRYGLIESAAIDARRHFVNELTGRTC